MMGSLIDVFAKLVWTRHVQICVIYPVYCMFQMYTVTVGAGLAPARGTSTCAVTLRHPGGCKTRPYVTF